MDQKLRKLARGKDWVGLAHERIRCGECMTMEDLQKEWGKYNSSEAFSYANPSREPGALAKDPDVKGFNEEDVQYVLAEDAGENDGPQWVAILLLKDGRFGYLSAGCDYTGWD